MDDLSIREGDRVAVGEYRSLRETVGWDAVAASDEDLQAALGRTWNVTARMPDGRLVALVRVLDDGALYASVWDMVVVPELQRTGVGRALFDRVIERVGVRNLVSLVATAAGRELYRSAGFHEESRGAVGMFRRPRGDDC